MNFMVEKSEFAVQTHILPAMFDSLGDVRAIASREAEACGLNPEAVYQVQLAVDEAFTNIIEHAYGGECLEDIEYTTQITNQGLVITLKDCGVPFNPDAVPAPDLESSLEKRQIGGLGLFFIRNLMDEVEFIFLPASNHQPGCNLLRMVKLRES